MYRYYVYIAAFLLTALLTIVLTPFAKKVAQHFDAIDYPGPRRINKTPIPRMGGVATYLSIFIVVVLGFIVGHVWPQSKNIQFNAHMDVNYYVLLLASLVVFMTGVIDDIKGISPKVKLLGQGLGAMLVVIAGVSIKTVVSPISGEIIDLGILAWPLTIVYLIAYSNIINLIDGLDGLASSVTLIVGLTMFALAELFHSYDASLLAVITAGAALGFLKHNFYPAKIFLGDSGSLVFGFLLGTISLLNVNRVASLTTLMLPIIIAGVPVVDTFSAIVRRKRANVSIGKADKGHIHHRLLSRGFSQRQVVLLVSAWTLFLCCGAVVMTQLEVGYRMILFAVLTVLSFVFAAKLHLFTPLKETATDDSSSSQKQVDA